MQAGKLHLKEVPAPPLLAQTVSWEQFRKIDADELKRGALRNKSREKIVDVSEMLRIAFGSDLVRD
jgi:hypothetical protein